MGLLHRPKKFKVIIKAILSILVLIQLSSFLNSCDTSQLDKKRVKVSLPWDLYNLAASIPSIQIEPSASPVDDVRQGKSQAAIIGREPTTEELKGMKDYVIAYDAVCFLIDTASYAGGENWIGGQTPVSKADGLTRLTSEDLKSIFNFYALTPANRWKLTGYYDWNVADSADPTGFKTWVQRPLPIDCAIKLQPGEYDTQTVIFQRLGLDEKTLSTMWPGMISEKFKREEEILTTVYPAGSTNDISPGSYKFLLGFASRQVTEIALKHVQVKVLPIDGINPLTDINSIYNGNYPFGRKIHLLLPDNNSTEETQLATFLQSSQWQILIASIGYLPASPKR